MNDVVRFVAKGAQIHSTGALRALAHELRRGCAEAGTESIVESIAGTGKVGAELVRELRGHETSTPLSRLFGWALWHDRVKPKLEGREPALSIEVVDDLDEMLNKAGVEVTRRGRHLVGSNGEAVAEVNAPAIDPATLDGGLRLLGSLQAQRLLRWEVTQAHVQWALGEADPRVLIVEGGFQGLAETIGAGANKGDQIRALVEAQAHLRWTWPDGSVGNMVAYNLRPHAPGRPAFLTLTLGEPLLPGFVHRLGKRSHARRLVPLVDLPPFIGRPRDRGALAAWQMRVVSYMRQHARRLADPEGPGGVPIPEPTMLALARPVSGDLARRAWDRWQRDGDDGPAFLVRVERDMYRLGPAHRTAHEFLVAAGQNELAAAKAGTASVARRARRTRSAGRRR